jgi:glycerol dehydrogenase-like iron-containing ADH family enzyme
MADITKAAATKNRKYVVTEQNPASTDSFSSPTMTIIMTRAYNVDKRAA